MSEEAEVISEKVLEQVKLELDLLSANRKFESIYSNLAKTFWALEGADVDWAAAGCGVGGGKTNEDAFEEAIGDILKNNDSLGGNVEGGLGVGGESCIGEIGAASQALKDLISTQGNINLLDAEISNLNIQKEANQRLLDTYNRKQSNQKNKETTVSLTFGDIFEKAEAKLKLKGVDQPWNQGDTQVSNFTEIWDVNNKLTGANGLLNQTQSVLIDQLKKYITDSEYDFSTNFVKIFNKAQKDAINVKSTLIENNTEIKKYKGFIEQNDKELVTKTGEKATETLNLNGNKADLETAIENLAGCIPAILTDAALIAAVAGLVVISICYIARTFAPSTAVTEEQPNLGNSALFQNSAIVSQWLVILAGLYAKAETISVKLMDAIQADPPDDKKITNLKGMATDIGTRIGSLETKIAAVNPSNNPVNGEYSKIYESKMLVPESIIQVKSDAWKKWRQVGDPGSAEREERKANNPFRAVEYVIQYKEYVTQEIWGWPGQSTAAPNAIKFDNLPAITLPPPAGRVPGFKQYTLCNNGRKVEVVLDQDSLENMINADWFQAVDGTCPQQSGFVCDGVTAGCREVVPGEPNGVSKEECENDCKCVEPGGGGGGGGGGGKKPRSSRACGGGVRGCRGY